MKKTETVEKQPTREAIIAAPKFQTVMFKIIGTAPLVIHRFSAKTMAQMKQKMEMGKAASSKKNRDPKNTDDIFNEARYVSKEGWDGFHAAAIRNAMISVCRLVNFKMTLAKMSIFCVPDGWDKSEPHIPLVRIHGTPKKLECMGRVATGEPYVCVHAAYYDWSANIKIRWDEDQFVLNDIASLLSRVGVQNGIGEGRPNATNSNGMGWGLFEIEKTS